MHRGSSWANGRVIDEPYRADPSLALLARLPALPQVDLAHSTQVTHLALALFDSLVDALPLEYEGRDLLAAAAHWHDSGQAIAEQGHHKHSYQLIMAAEPSVLGAAAMQQVACVARYHRKALPSAAHAGYGGLVADLQARVRALSSLLRIADGLDYSHRSLVRSARARLGPSRLEVFVQAGAEADIELRRALQKADLFEQEYDRHVIIQRED
jgi:exopolyphosphatase/guanosine-5'-triphosphate,3'-diphosphate pyrophosphatase